MWGLLFLLVYLLLLFLIRTKKDDYISKMVLLFFSSFWLLSLFISSFNPNGLYDVSDTTYFILLINVISFFVGYSVISNQEKYSREEYAIKFEQSLAKYLNNWVFLLLALLSTVIVISAVLTQMAILAFDANEMSGIATGENDVLFQNSYISIIYNVFIPVLFHIFLFLFPYLLLVKKNKLYAFAAGIFIVSRALIGGSRDSIFIIIIYFIVAFILRRVITHKQLRKHRNRFVKISVVVILSIGIYFLMVFLTSLRHGNLDVNEQSFTEYSEGLQESFVNYACGPFRAMDYGLNHHYDDYAGRPLLGRSTFSGLEDLLQLFGNKVGINFNPVSQKTVQHQQDHRFSVSAKFHTFNYAFTDAMIFYYDGGIIAVIIFSFLFGLSTKLVIRMMYREMTLPAALLVGFFVFGIYKSTFTWFMIKHWAWLYVIILLTWHHFEKKKAPNRNI